MGRYFYILYVETRLQDQWRQREVSEEIISELFLA